MKKTTKIVLAVLGCLLILFLLLPVIVPNAGASKKQAMQTNEQTAAEPQIFTSNPLTKLVKSLARIFKKNQPAPQPVQASAEQPLSEAQARARFGRIITDEDYDSANMGEEGEEEEESNFSNTKEEANIYNPTEGEWVLIQQTAPEGSVSGMHEVNAKDNAYERYVKQERNARFTPTASVQSKGKEVPDSKLARIFQPIKRFLGIGNGTPVQESTAFDTAVASAGKAAKKSKTDDLSRNNKTSDLAKFKNPSMPQTNFSPKLSAGNNNSREDSTAELFNMLYPAQSIQNAAEMVANSKFPNPKNSSEKAQRAQLIRERQEQYSNYFNSQLQEHMVRLAGGQGTSDMLSNVITSCAGTKSAFLGDSCVSPNALTPRESTNHDELRLQNRTHFYKEVQIPLPNARVAVVLSKADPKQDLEETLQMLQGASGAIEGNQAGLDDQQMQQKKDLVAAKYLFMMQNTDCSDAEPCYWVANEVPAQQTAEKQVPLMKDTVNASGVQFSTPPSKKIRQLDKDFVQEQLDKLPPNATDEQRQQVFKEAQNTHTPYVLVSIKTMRRQQDRNINLVKDGQENPANALSDIERGRAFYAGSAQTALQLSKDLGDPYIFYGNNNLVLDSKQNPTTAERSTQLTNDLIRAANLVKGIYADIQQMASQESITNHLQPAVEKTNKELEAQQKEFSKTGKTPTNSLF